VNRDDVIRTTLWTTAVFNLGAAFLFAFPASIGRLAGMPPEVPPLYAAMAGLFVALFGGAYAWAASDAAVRRPIVVLGAIGKASAFVVVVTCWLFGAASGLTAIAIVGDLVFASIFAWWLLAPAHD
jgi:hypothetical protein